MIPFAPGQVIECLYPEENREGVPLNFKRRQFVVRKIRDTAIEPVKDTRRNVLRGRFLVLAQDVNKHGWRQFYFDSMWRPMESDIKVFQLATYDPVDEEPQYDRLPQLFTLCDLDLAKELSDEITSELAALNVCRNIAILPLVERNPSQ